MRRLKLRKAFTLIEPGPVVLEGLAARPDRSREERRTIHAGGDGTFVADGARFDRRRMMRATLPDGV